MMTKMIKMLLAMNVLMFSAQALTTSYPIVLSADFTRAGSTSGLKTGWTCSVIVDDNQVVEGTSVAQAGTLSCSRGKEIFDKVEPVYVTIRADLLEKNSYKALGSYINNDKKAKAPGQLRAIVYFVGGPEKIKKCELTQDKNKKLNTEQCLNFIERGMVPK